MVSRVKIFDLLLKNGGELKTSDITKGLRVSEPTARHTMREFYALGIAEISTISGYSNAELKISLRSEYEWFKGKEFEKLREGFIPANNNDGANNDNNVIDSSNGKTNDDDDNNKTAASAACDSHTLKVDSPPETHEKNYINSAAYDRPLLEEEKNSNNDKSSSQNMNSTSVNSKENKIRKDHSSYSVVNNNSQDCNYYSNTQESCDNKAIEDNSDNVSLWGANRFQLVTQ
jgi:hypothetical protein